MLIYQTDKDPGFYYANGSAWIRIGDAAQDYWLPSTGDDIYFPHKIALGGFTTAQDHSINASNYFTAKGAVRGAVQISENNYAEGMLGVLDPSPLGVPLSVTNVGVLGIKSNSGSNGAAIYGWNNQNHPNGNFAGLMISNGSGTYNNYALYARASGGSNNYAGYCKGRLVVEGNTQSDNASDSLSTLVEAQVKHHYPYDTKAFYGVSNPQPGWGIGMYGQGGWYGIYGFGDGTSYSGTTVGVYGSATGNAGSRIGVYGQASNSGGASAYGVYGYASGATESWAGYFVGSAYVSGDLRIGTSTQAAGYSLSVNGKIACEEVLVELDSGWPDYVFNPGYPLLKIADLEKCIAETGHLPGFPSSREIKENGIELGEIQKQIVEKIEELTLYTIQQQRLIDKLTEEVNLLKNENEGLQKRRSE
jgi:hypothetical protein